MSLGQVSEAGAGAGVIGHGSVDGANAGVGGSNAAGVGGSGAGLHVPQAMENVEE